MDNRRGGRPDEDEHTKLASGDPRSTGMEEDCAGRPGQHWNVTPDRLLLLLLLLLLVVVVVVVVCCMTYEVVMTLSISCYFFLAFDAV